MIRHTAVTLMALLVFQSGNAIPLSIQDDLARWDNCEDYLKRTSVRVNRYNGQEEPTRMWISPDPRNSPVRRPDFGQHYVLYYLVVPLNRGVAVGSYSYYFCITDEKSKRVIGFERAPNQ